MDFLFWYILFIVFFIGIITGSFLNCLIWRSYCGESVCAGRSYCPNCRHKLAWYDLFPIASFLALRGKCRYCQKQISWQYPAVEVAMGLMFSGSALTFAPRLFMGDFSFLVIFELAVYWAFFSALAVIFVTDARWYYIPDGATISGIIAAIFIIFINAGGGYSWRFLNWETVIGAIISAIAAMLFFLAIFLISKGNWLGFGDVKYAFLMGLVLGFPGIMIGMFFANFFGAILGLALVGKGKKKMSSQIPFGPFLVVGTIVAFFFADPMFDWYLSLTF